MMSPHPTVNPQVPERRHPALALSARVIRWPAPAGGGAVGVYAVQVCGLAPEDAATAANTVTRLGLRASPSAGALVIEGRAPFSAAFDRAAADLGGRTRDVISAASGALERFRNAPRALRARGWILDLKCPLVVGVLNATPDSFYDQGRYFGWDAALARAGEMVAEGADLIEVGGETARPGPPVDPEEETRRVVPLVEALVARLPVPVSVDTYKPAVAQRALASGAALINDISGLDDLRMAEIAAASGAALVVMHIQGRPKVRQPHPVYRSVVDDVYTFLESRTAAAEAAGVPPSHLVVDPGFSFGKAPEHDVELLRRLGEFRSLGYPIYLATSRKNYIRDLLGLPFEELLEGTAAAVAYGVAQGAQLVRTHDVRFMARLLRMMQAILHPGAADDGSGGQDAAGVDVRGQE
jgi:dihydropteroate synthase